jgi:hypothetical protein
MTSEEKAITTERQRCRAIRKDGKPCTAFAVLDGYCIGHHPNSIEARRKGGYHSSKKHRLDAMLPLRLRPVLELLEKALDEVHEGKLKPSEATAIAALAGAIVRTLEAGLFEERLIEMERHFGMGRLLKIRHKISEEKEVTHFT